MWKRLKRWLFGHKEKEIVDKINLLSADEIRSKPLYRQFIRDAKFKCMSCGKTVARLKNKYKRVMVAFGTVYSYQFQIVKNQHNKKKVPKFDLNSSGCHHCGHDKLEHDVTWEE